jgi:hypothetical protein
MQVNEKTFFGGLDDFVTLKHLTIRGTNFQIGQKLAELAIERNGSSPTPLTVDLAYANARRVYFQRNYPICWERMRGAATAFGLDPDDERYDLTILWYNLDLPLSVMACSVAYYPPSITAGSRGYLSRNYDFSIDTTVAEVMQKSLSPEVKNQLPPIMSEPYIMEWYPEDGGYASLAIHAFDTLSGTLDGINSAGLVVSILADEEAAEKLGPNLEFHPGPPQVVGLHELQVMRFLLDTCATTDEAKKALLMIKQYYGFIPCHYIVADRAGNSFLYENSTGRNVQYIIDGTGQPQVVTNFQVHSHPTPDQMPQGPLTSETNAFWRYQTLADSISKHSGLFTPNDIKTNNARVNVMKVFEEMRANGINPANEQARTLWHSLYDQQARTAEFSFYLGDEVHADGTCTERRSDYLRFALDA